MQVNPDIAIDEITPAAEQERGPLAVLHGIPIEKLLAWAAEIELCPNAEVRAALLNPHCMRALREIAAHRKRATR